MTQASDLLRLLEPAVRPVGGTSTGQGNAATTFEGRSFDQLLDQARMDATPAADPTADAGDPSAASPHEPLPGLGHIENASLARLLADRPTPPAELTP